MACLRTTLPITFRINGSGKFADALRRRLETDFLAGLVREGQQVRNCNPSPKSNPNFTPDPYPNANPDPNFDPDPDLDPHLPHAPALRVACLDCQQRSRRLLHRSRTGYLWLPHCTDRCTACNRMNPVCTRESWGSHGDNIHLHDTCPAVHSCNV